jgi:hypothetical protein
LRDIDYGFKIAKAVGRLDLGQCVVVRRQVVTALEAVEGTDEAIRRGGRLAGRGAVVVKVCKPGQDLRFDLPAVGPGTIEAMREVEAGVLAIEAGKTLMFDRQEMIALADQAKIAVWGVAQSLRTLGRENEAPPAVGKPGGTGVLTCAFSRVPKRALMVGGAHPTEIFQSSSPWAFGPPLRQKSWAGVLPAQYIARFGAKVCKVRLTHHFSARKTRPTGNFSGQEIVELWARAGEAKASCRFFRIPFPPSVREHRHLACDCTGGTPVLPN